MNQPTKIKVYDLTSWSDFSVTLQEIRDEARPLSGDEPTRLLFRGQSDAFWDLDTTLERATPDRGWTWEEYFELITKTRSQVQTLTDKQWDFPDKPEDGWGKEYDSDGMPPAYPYWVYLRHHAFPSPLLDWTRSPYVAAFFAFRHASETAGEKDALKKDALKRVAIYCYQHAPNRIYLRSSAHPTIKVCGPHVTSHPRHVLQQSVYTMCSQFDSRWTFKKHSSVFAAEGPDRVASDQDRLWKITLPVRTRVNVLNNLNEYNLNAYSLMQTQDALLETMALNYLEFDKLLKVKVAGPSAGGAVETL